MMFTRFRTSCFGLPFAGLLFSLALPAHAAAPAPIVMPSQWMSALASQRLAPGYRQFGDKVDALASALAASCEGQPAAASAARQRWLEAAHDLRELSPLPIGPVLESRLLRRIDFWPTRPAQIETSIAQYAKTPANTARIGLPARGLPALEYLLFDTDRPALANDGPACRYAVWLARDTAAGISATVSAWPDWIAGLDDAEPEREARLLADGINILIGSTETLRLKYLEKPLRPHAGPPETDAWRSGSAHAGLMAYFSGLRAGLQGDEGMPGLTAMLRGRGLLTLAAQLDQRIDAVQTALAALPEDFAAEAARPLTDTLISELGRLQRLLAEEVADKMSVAVGFGENDGD
ncbi:MAG: imelysin family protein [Azoarcus sp.]|nr:imelysin family protein [Azoarcus sp.]